MKKKDIDNMCGNNVSETDNNEAVNNYFTH